MGISNWLTILAILLAPLLAVQVQKRLELLRERRQKESMCSKLSWRPEHKQRAFQLRMFKR